MTTHIVHGSISKGALDRLLQDASIDQLLDGAPQGQSIVVYGFAGCGKTINAEAMAKTLGLPVVIDEWREGDYLPPQGVLAITGAVPKETEFRYFQEVMVEVRRRRK